MVQYADMHVHTNHSDGTLPINEVFAELKSKGIAVAAITDHDTVDHWEQVQACAKKANIQTVRGVEISCYDYQKLKRVHLVGLWLGEHVPHVKRLCDKVLAGRDAYHRDLVASLAKTGYEISYDDVKKKAPFNTVFKIHIFQALMDAYPNEMSMEKYRELFAGKGDPNQDVKMGYAPIEEAIDAIAQDGGLSVLAHPCEYDNYDEVGTYKQMGLCGIEVSHPSMRPHDYPLTERLAAHYDLARSGGSDFHDRALTPWLGEFGISREEFIKLEDRQHAIT